MANRERSRSPSSSEQPSTPDEAFDAGKTTLDLDDISEEELESLYFEDDTDDSSLLNLQTLSGLGLILAGVVYLLSEIGVWTAPLLGLGAALPLLVGVIVILVGFGVLTWSPSARGLRRARGVPESRPHARAHRLRHRGRHHLRTVCAGLLWARLCDAEGRSALPRGTALDHPGQGVTPTIWEVAGGKTVQAAQMGNQLCTR